MKLCKIRSKFTKNRPVLINLLKTKKIKLGKIHFKLLKGTYYTYDQNFTKQILKNSRTATKTFFLDF